MARGARYKATITPCWLLNSRFRRRTVDPRNTRTETGNPKSMCDDIGQRLSLGVVVAERRRSVPSTNSVSHSRKVTVVGIETDQARGV